MPYLVVDNFSAGLDSRRHVLNSKDGTLSTLKNAHITRGGEIEKRKTFAQFASLPANTFGLETTQDKVYVFGSVASPTMPAGVTYQRLQHPDGLAMTKVVWSTVYGGLPFVIAEYAGGDRRCFWDGTIVRDWYVGIATAAMGSITNLAEHLRSDFSNAGYSCTRSGSVLSISGPLGRPFEVTASITSPMTATVNKAQTAMDAVQGKVASGSFTVTGGTEKPAHIIAGLRYINASSLPDITGIYVNGVEILGLSPGSGVRWDTIPNAGLANVGPRFAYTLWTLINANSSASGYSSEYKITNLSGYDKGSVAILADSALGDSANGFEVQVEFATDPSSVFYVNELANTFTASPYNPSRTIGKFAGTNISFDSLLGVIGSTLQSGAYSGLTSVKVDGVEIMGVVVPWKESNSATALEVVNAINSHSSNPEYTVENENGKVTIYALPGTGSSSNGKVVTVTTQGDTVVGGVVAMSGGTTNFAGASQVTTVTIGGTFTVGGKCSITIIDPIGGDPYIFGASRVAGIKPEFSVTYKAKEYAAAGSTMYFSGLNDATKWDVYDLGSGFIDMSNNFGGREDLTGFGVYQDKLAAFSRRNVQLWFLDADPAQNQQQQILANTGCIAPDSVVSMGAIDLLYLADNGVRSLRARESTDSATATDIGSPIDSIVINHMAGLTGDQVSTSRAVVEPIDGRYWLALGSKIFVLSYFPGANISAWSTYEPGFYVEEMAVKGSSVYVRSGNVIYLYGGVSGGEYDSSQVIVELPYLDARKPATFKRSKGVDVTIEGEWKIYMGFDHTNPSARDLIATPNQPTFALGKIDAVGTGTHFGLRLVSQAAGAARIANVIVHYDEMQAKHEAG